MGMMVNSTAGWISGTIGAVALLPIVLFVLIITGIFITWKYKLFNTMATGLAVLIFIGFVLLCLAIVWTISNAGVEGIENGDPWILYIFGFAVLLWTVGAIAEHLGLKKHTRLRFLNSSLR